MNEHSSCSPMNSPKSKIYELKDAKFPADEFFDYPNAIKRGRVPIVIDNGSCQTRVGWATDSKPRLIFKSLIARVRKEKGKKEVTSDIQVGNEIANIEAVRFQLKTPFDRNVVVQYEAMEQILDYIFLRLGINTEGRVDHAMILTEAYLNPNYTRQMMTELLFETYGIPSVCYGVDSLFSYRLHHGNKSGVLLSLGYHTMHVIPILNGVVIAEHSRRINIGGFHIVSYLHRLLQLKYPAHANSITLSRAEEILHEHTFIPVDYKEELQRWATPKHYDENVHIFQLAYVAPTPSATSTLTKEQQKEKKKEMQRRLYEINARKREEKLNEEEELLNQLLDARELLETGQMKSLKKALTELELPDDVNLGRAISACQQRMTVIKEKMQNAAAAVEAGDDPKPAPVQPQPARDKEQLEAWVAQLREQREDLLARRGARRQRRRDLAQRRTAAAQERMRLISQLARKEKKEDNFGMRDEDWDVYKAISKDAGSSDSEEELERLSALETELKAADPAWAAGGPQHYAMGAGESHQLHVATERIRATQLIFDPSIVGSHEAGLSETLEFVLKQFSPQDQLSLVGNVFVTGGCASIPGLVERLERDLLEMRPFQSSFSVSRATDPALSAWSGARATALSSHFKQCLLTKQVYDERGADFFQIVEGGTDSCVPMS